MHHMGVYETHVVLKDSEQLAQKKIAKVKCNSFTSFPQEAKMAASKLSSSLRELAGILWAYWI